MSLLSSYMQQCSAGNFRITFSDGMSNSLLTFAFILNESKDAVISL